MNYSEDPFHSTSARDQLFHQNSIEEDDSSGGNGSSGLKAQLQEQDVHLGHLHRSLCDARVQTDALNSELREHNELLGRLGARMEEAEGSFESASKRVRLLYNEITDKKFTWTASIMIFVLTILLVILLFT